MANYALHDFTTTVNEQIELDFDVGGYTFGGNTAHLTIRRRAGGAFVKDLTITGTPAITGSIARNEATDSPGEIDYDELGGGAHDYAIEVKASAGRVMWKIQGVWTIGPVVGTTADPVGRLTDATVTLDGANVAAVTLATTPLSFGIPAGGQDELQYNNAGIFGAADSFTFNAAAGRGKISDNLTDTTSKVATVGGNHYTNAEEPVGLLRYESSTSASGVHIGGGNSSYNAATTVYVYTAANNTTVTGTVAMSVDAAQNVRIGTGAAAVRLDVDGAVAITDAMTAPSTASNKLTLYVDSSDTHLHCKYGDGTTHILDQKAGALVLVDGITAPSTLAGSGLIYIDTADGDLKIKYGDGTVKTIVVDT